MNKKAKKVPAKKKKKVEPFLTEAMYYGLGLGPRRDYPSNVPLPGMPGFTGDLK